MTVTQHRVLFSSATLEQLFEGCFWHSENTRLIGGAAEPLYVPAGLPCAGEAQAYHRLYYREDYFASALHEIAHWCIAGPARRLQRDFGYWYEPDGRSAAQQSAFQTVEVRPQALEWCLAQACGHPFRVSLDNLDGGAVARASEARFLRAVIAEGRRLQQQGLPPRAARFFATLARVYATGMSLPALCFADAPAND